MRAPDPSKLSPEEIVREVASILAAGYVRLCADANQATSAEANEQPSRAAERDDSAPRKAGARP